MSYYAVWMDSKEGKIFEFTPGQVKEQIVKLSGRERQGQSQNEQHLIPHEYFNHIIEKIKTAHEILLLGPGQAKNQFTKFLETHHQKDLKKKIVATETMNHATEAQIVAQAKKFFKAHNLFEAL